MGSRNRIANFFHESATCFDVYTRLTIIQNL
jgi:hypothetical protein